MFFLKPAGKGDYQQLLVGGMTSHLSRHKGLLQLERVGPFIPPLCVAGSHLILTEAMRSFLASSPFTDWNVKPVKKAHIVRWEWKKLSDADNLRGEPEDMILSHPHDPDVAISLGDLYELVLPFGCYVIGYETSRSITKYDLRCKTIPNGDLFQVRLPGGTRPMCSRSFREWIESLDEVRPWIRFLPAKIKLAGNV
ncbi:MAG: hypothetical protein WCH39_25375 [Schlesneria sp.]